MPVNAHHMKQVPGRKTEDVKDAEWIAQLLRHGLLSPSFVPPPPIREPRDLTRRRARLAADKAAVADRLRKVLGNPTSNWPASPPTSRGPRAAR